MDDAIACLMSLFLLVIVKHARCMMTHVYVHGYILESTGTRVRVYTQVCIAIHVYVLEFRNCSRVHVY